MRKKDVSLGCVYEVKVSGRLTRVRLLTPSPHGGWDGRNEETGRGVRIRTAGRIRRLLAPARA